MSKVKNPNSPLSRIKVFFKSRWSGSDIPTAEARFQVNLFAKDLGVFIFLPMAVLLIYVSIEKAFAEPRTPKRSVSMAKAADGSNEGPKSQIIDFSGSKKSSANYINGFPRRASGTLVKLRLLNTVETYGTAPVHAQVIDASLGSELMGSTVLGDATSDSNFERIQITFTRVKSIGNRSISVAIKARALSLNGTLGLDAKKKEGFFARSALNAGTKTPVDSENGLNGLLAKALANGLLQEFGSAATVERNKSQVLTLNAGEVFFAELTDDFPKDGN